METSLAAPLELSAANATPGLCMLVVEDNEADAYLIQRVLSRHPMVGRVVRAIDGGMAEEMIARGEVTPNLAFIDLYMPRKNGFDLLMALAGRAERGFTMVVLTSSNLPTDGLRSRLRGAAQVIVKPDTVEQLEAVLTGAIDTFCTPGQSATGDQDGAGPLATGSPGGSAAPVATQAKASRGMSDAARTTDALRSTSRMAQVGGWGMDFSSERTSLSPELCALLDGSPAPQMSIADALGLWLEADRPALVRALDAVIEHGEPLTFEGRTLAPDGVTRWWRLVGEPDFVADRCVGLRGAAQDITRWRAEAGARSADMAADAMLARLATMSHEIRTPLNGVLGMAHVMAGDDLSGPQRQRLGVIAVSGEALLGLFDELVDVSLLAAGKLDLNWGVVDAQELADGARAAFVALSEGKSLQLKLSLAPSALGLWVGDSHRLRQIVRHLVSNAVKFTDAGSVSIEIACIDERLVIRVRDTGVGIAPEALPFVFDKFVQADDSLTRRHGGSGMGLTICRELLALMGGDIAVESTPGMGALVTVTLPARWVAAARQARQATMAGDAGLRVLVAEDNAVNRLVLEGLLAAFGIHPVMVEDGRQAVDAWRSGAWDALLMDIQMPVIDGLSATRVIRAAEREEGRPRTPIIAVTANTTPRQLAEYRAAGMDDCIPKPINPILLIQALEAVSSTMEGLPAGLGAGEAAALNRERLMSRLSGRKDEERGSARRGGNEMKPILSARLALATAGGANLLKAGSAYLRPGAANAKLLVGAIVAVIVIVAALDFWTSGELVASTLFILPLALCALQPSKRLLWTTAVAAALLTVAAGLWGENRDGISTSSDGMITRILLSASLFVLTAFIHLWLRKVRLGTVAATQISRQSESLAAQNEQLALLIAAGTRDVGERADAEIHLAQMEARYRGLLEAAPDAMVVVDQGGAIVLLNLQAEKQFGYHRDELVGLPVKNIIPEGFAERLIADGTRTAAEALAQQIGTGLELIGRRKDGSEFPMELMLSPLENADGILVTAAIRDIGVRRDAEIHLAQMEARYRGLLEAAPDAMVVVDQGGAIVLLNLQAEKQFGYHRDELVGQQVKNIIPKGFAERLIADGTRTAAEALAQQIGTGLELIGRRKDGSEFPMELMLSPLENADGILVTAAIRDIGVRRDAEIHLAQMEARYRGLLEAAPDAMVVVDQGGAIVLLNLQAEKQFGYHRDELVGQQVKNIIPKGFAERLIADGTRTAAEALAQQIGTGLELIGRRKDGSEFPMELMLSPLENADGILVTAAIRDVTARQADQQALRASEEWHRLAVEITEIGTWFWDITRNEITWSDQFRKMFGLTSDDPVSYEAIFQNVHQEDQWQVDRSIRNTLERDEPYDVEYRIIWPDGSLHWIASKGRVRRGPAGAPQTMQGTILDVTERKAGQESLRERPALERTSAELMRSNVDLQQFAYVAAHDLQEPLRMVSSYTQLLANRYKGRLDDKADEFIALAVDGAQRMQLLIADLLAYCQVGTAGQELCETSMDHALDLALQNLKGALDESGGVVTRGSLPVIVADHAQFVQLFQNLVGNALKYRAADPPRVHVSAKKNRAKEWVFSVSDNGLGIEPRHFEKIFMMFQRLHPREAFSGTGIGLSLCRKIVERHGGRIWVESASAEGSTFHVALPQGGV